MTRLPAIITLVLLLGGAAGTPPAAAQVRYVPTEESRVWIVGTSNVTDFTCATQALDGQAWIAQVTMEERIPEVRARNPATTARDGDTSFLTVRVPVETLDCGERRQNRDMRKAMRASEHPTITYELVGADLLSDPESGDGPFEIRAQGVLTIAGTARTVEVTLEAYRQEDGSISARGYAPLRMTDFDIRPPSALLGLIRVRDEIEVHFDIQAVPAPD